MKSIIRYISFVVLACVFAACQDDFDFRAPGDIPEGTATVTAEIDFMPMAEALSEKAESRGTVAPPGKGMDEIVDVCIVVYDKEKKFVKIISEFTEPLKVTSVDRTDADTGIENGITAESQTKRGTLKFDIALGEYYFYAVANLGEYASSSNGGSDIVKKSTLEVLEENQDSIKTPDGLKRINCKWDASNYRNNREMIGYFTKLNATSKSAESRARTSTTISGEPLIRIDTNNITIHSWLKRVASKVTIEFDGSNLLDHVSIYIRRATIHNVPANAKLGEENTVSDTTGLGASVHHLDYGLGDDYKNWPCLTRNSHTITSVQAPIGNEFAIVPSHAEDAYALYFYENRQGTYDGQAEYDKRQYPSVSETVKDKQDIRDKLKCGTYIEVEGYYVGSSSSNQTSGQIKYRFMLGQDTKFDYDANRNCHYKLTLHFRGNANDVDWHIDYDEDVPSISSPDLYYISYLYDREMSMPVRINPGTSYELAELSTEIICNHWAPEDPFKANRKQYPTDTEYEFTWRTTWYDEHSLPIPDAIDNEQVNPDVEPMVYNDDIYAGFLSLKKTHDVVILRDANTNDNSVPKLKDYWKTSGIGERSYKIPKTKGTHTYDTDDDSPEANGSYTVEKDDSTFLFNMPFYTRERQISPYLTYSGNNPYSYPRKAVVRITAKFEDKAHPGTFIYRHKRVTIQQVERVQNPMGIYRDANNADPFDVYLMRNDPENLDRFVEIISDGPWRAEIVGDESSWVLLNNGTKTIYGGSKTPIRFRVKPSGTITPDRVRNAAIRVYYNNFTCVHLILLRQGYAPVVIPAKDGYAGASNTSKWATYNLFTKDSFMKSPIGTGSLFRHYATLEDPINEVNNLIYPLGKNVDKQLYISNTTTTDTSKWMKKTWSNIKSTQYAPGTGTDLFNPIKAKGYDDKLHTFRLPYYEDFIFLMNNTETAYGVVYADGATETATTTEDAFRFLDYTGNVTRSHKGMRGVISYAWDTGTGKGKFQQVFFPISASGYGRRKQWISEGDNRGVLRYSDVKNPLTDNRVPVFDLCQQMGAIYWYQAGKDKGFDDGKDRLNSYSWEINYYTYAFGAYTPWCFGTSTKNAGSDALLIKCIQVD